MNDELDVWSVCEEQGGGLRLARVAYTLVTQGGHPGQGYPCVFVKAKRAQSVHDDETWKEGGVAPTLNAFDNNGESRATVLALPIQDGQRVEKRQNGAGIGRIGDPSYTLDTTGVQSVATFALQPADQAAGKGALKAVATDVAPTIGCGDGHSDRGLREHAQATQDVAPKLTASNDPSRSPQSQEVTQQVAAVQAAGLGVRRLTPRECERLMGWPDDHTRWAADGTEIADSSRYRMCGNGVAAPVAKYVAECIEAIL